MPTTSVATRKSGKSPAAFEKVLQGTPADLTKTYMPRVTVQAFVRPADGLSLEEAGRALAIALVRNETLPLERIDDRWVVRAGRPMKPIVELPKKLTEPLDNEYATRALWAVTLLYPPGGGRIKVQLRRVSPRHGFLSTYQNEPHCRCLDCTAANAAAAADYRRRVNPPKPKQPRRHGAHCWKYGCYCDARREADRLRQARRREKLRAEKAAAEKASVKVAGAKSTTRAKTATSTSPRRSPRVRATA